MRKWICAVAAVAIALPVLRAGADAPDFRRDPRETARAWVHALADGDAEKAKTLILHNADTAKEQATLDFIDAMASVNVSLKKVGDAAVNKWGKAGRAIQVRTPADALDRDLDGPNCEVHLAPDGSATLSIGDRDPIRLHRDGDSNYLIDLPQMMSDNDQMIQLTPMLRAMSAAADSMTTDINAEKFKNADEATQVMETRIENAMKGFLPGAIGPTTQLSPGKEPTTQPLPGPGSAAQ